MSDAYPDAALWQERFERWLKPRYATADTIKNYLSSLRPFWEFCAEQALSLPAELTRDRLEQYRGWLSTRRVQDGTRGLSVGTQVARLMAVRRLGRFLAQEGYLPYDPATQLDLPRRPEKLPGVLSEAQVQRLLETPDVATPAGVHDRTLLELLYGTALRNSELVTMTLDQVDLAQRLLVIERGKGLRGRLLPLGEEALAWLTLYLEKARPQLLRSPVDQVFLGRWGHGPLTRGGLAQKVRQLGRRAGLPRVTPHTLRHSCATHMLRRGAELRHLQKMLGHASSSTTELYTRVEISDLHRVLSRCHPRESR